MTDALKQLIELGQQYRSIYRLLHNSREQSLNLLLELKTLLISEPKIQNGISQKLNTKLDDKMLLSWISQMLLTGQKKITFAKINIAFLSELPIANKYFAIVRDEQTMTQASLKILFLLHPSNLFYER